MSSDHQMRDDRPTTEEIGIPWWIKLMWAAGIIWILCYVYFGLQHSPETW